MKIKDNITILNKRKPLDIFELNVQLMKDDFYVYNILETRYISCYKDTLVEGVEIQYEHDEEV